MVFNAKLYFRKPPENQVFKILETQWEVNDVSAADYWILLVKLLSTLKKLRTYKNICKKNLRIKLIEVLNT